MNNLQAEDKIQLITDDYVERPAEPLTVAPVSEKPLAIEERVKPVAEPEKVYNNVSSGRRGAGYQRQLARALMLIRKQSIKPNNRQICEHCNCGSKVGARILTDLVKLYPAEFERTATGRVKYNGGTLAA